nr:hypothetical protein [Tanacetum cinerariifolium]
MDLLSFIRTADPTKVRIGKRKRDEDDPKLLETIVGRVVPFQPAKQGDSASGGHGIGIDVVTKTIVRDVAPAQLKHQKKRKTKVVDAGEPSHPAKKLRDDYRASGGPTVGGKSQSSIQCLFVRAMQNAEVWGGIMPTLPFVSSSVSTTPEREDGDHTELLVGANLPEVDSVVRTSMSIIMSATTTPTADSAAIAKEKLVGSYVFGADSPFAGGSHPISGSFSDCFSSDFLVGGIRTVRMRAEYHIKEKRWLKAIVEEKNRKSLWDEVTALNERNTILEKKRNALDVKVTDLQAVVVSKDCELADSAAQLTSIKSHNDNHADQVHELQVSSSELKEKLSNFENLMERLEEFQDAQLKVVNDKFDKLYADFVEVTLHLEESKAIEKGMQDGLAAGIIHGREGRVLTDVDAHNPAAEANYVSALQQLQSVNFSLLAELKPNKDASIEAVMNILRLEEHLAARLGLNE